VQFRFPPLQRWTKKPVLVYPIPPAPPTAVLVDGFRSAGNTRVFENGWTAEALDFAPAAIAATPAQLDALRTTPIPSLRNAIIALVRPGEPALSDQDREQLWRAFRVPVFEQRIVPPAGSRMRGSRRPAHRISGCPPAPRRNPGNRALRMRTHHASSGRAGAQGNPPQNRRLRQIISPKGSFAIIESTADVAKLADAPDLGSGSRKGVKVQVLSSAPVENQRVTRTSRPPKRPLTLFQGSARVAEMRVNGGHQRTTGAPSALGC
jgi:hypothetical protein